MPLLDSLELRFQGLPTTRISKNWTHIDHDCSCNDEQLDDDLLHLITSLDNKFLGREGGKLTNKEWEQDGCQGDR
jgi:hypothetical protein